MLRNATTILGEESEPQPDLALHILKRDDDRRAGVLEYLVLCVEERELHWFSFKARRPLVPNPRGIVCSRVFPGLWIAAQALLDRTSDRVAEVVREGLVSCAHADFVERLEAARRAKAKREHEEAGL